jgi:hypothetical protein
MKAAVVTCWKKLKKWTRDFLVQKTAKNMRISRPRALSTSSSMSPAPYFPSVPLGLGGPNHAFTEVFRSSQPPSVSQQTSNNLNIATQDSDSGTISLLYDCPSMITISAADADHREFPWYSVRAPTLERITSPISIGECTAACLGSLLRPFSASSEE